MKWTSVACAHLMVIAAFYVMTADVSADEVALPDTNVDEIVSNIEHNDRRITISNSMASSPAVAVGADGDTHIAWVDGEIGSQSVSWKRSNDSMSTFTSDEAITTSYYSISSISILLGSAFGTAIAFEGKLTSDASPSVYFLYSEDDDDWSNAYAVSVGSSPSLTTDGDAVYIAMNIITEETTRYSLAAFRLIDGSINATLLAALPVSASDGDIAFFDGLLNVAMVEESTDTLYSPGWTYDIDIAETVTSVSVIFYAVADDAGTIPGDDIKLDVSSTSNLEHTVTWALSTTQYQTSFEGTCGWLDNDADGYMKVGLQRCVAEKAKVIVINGTSDNGDYGLDAVSTGIYRYSADDQVYLINLNVSTANARFQQGMNTIILPRAIALQCQLNDTLYNLQSIGSTPLAGASFYSTDQDSASASSHVIAVITMNVTYQQAEDILEMLTHNSTGARIGNNVTVSSTSVYLMHLPNDVLSSIPTSVTNSGLGGAPNFFDPLDVISDIANLVFDFLIWIATGGVLLLWVHLVIMGLEIIANLITTAIAVVEEAVDAIVDAFLEFVDWMVEFIQNLLDSSFSSGSEERGRTIDSHLASIAASSNEVVEEYNATGTVTAETQARYQNSLGALIVYAMLIGVTLFFILIFVIGLTNVWGFLLGTIIGIMAGYLIQSMFDTAFEPSDETGSDGNLPDSAGVVMVAEAMGLAPDSDDHSAGAERWRTIETGIGGILDWHALLAGAIILVESKNPSVLCIKGFVISLISIAIGTSDYALDCPALGWISISLGLIGLGLSVVDFVKNYGLNVNKKMDIISMSIDSMALALAFDLIEYPEM